MLILCLFCIYYLTFLLCLIILFGDAMIFVYNLIYYISGVVMDNLQELSLLLNRAIGLCRGDVTEAIVLNSEVGVGYRMDVLDGIDYVVMPCIMIKEGIWTSGDSGGGIYYSRGVLGNSVRGWDNKPVTLGHPRDGKAWDKDKLSSWAIGFLLNSKMVDDVKLYSELWVRLDKVSDDFVNYLDSGGIFEVSTGLYLQMNRRDVPDGAVASAVNIVPDHLAILLDDVGACSVSDGAGAPRNNSRNIKKDGEEEMEAKDVGDVSEESSEVSAVNVENTSDDTGVEAVADAKVDNSEVASTDVDGTEGDLVNNDVVSDVVVEYDDAIMKEAIAYYNKRRVEYIDKMVSNSSCPFSREDLEGKKIDELDKLSILLENASKKDVIVEEESVRVVNYGVGNVVANEVSPLPEVD